MAPTRNTLAQGVFLLGLAALTWSFATMSCGGGGGGGAVASPQASPLFRTHVSTTSGTVIVPASSVDLVVRAITFTPTNPNDLVVRAMVQGTFTCAGPIGPGALRVRILDASGGLLGERSNDDPSSTGVGQGYLLQTSLETDQFMPGPFPSTFYTVQLVISTSAGWAGSIDTCTFKVFTAENVTVTDPSGLIAG